MWQYKLIDGHKFRAQDALKILRSRDMVHEFIPQAYQSFKYYSISWMNEDELVETAVCSTQYRDQSLAVPFGLQDLLLRQGLVEEVLLFCRRWNYIFRIPAADFRQFETTMDEGRRLFQVRRDGLISSEGTIHPIDISGYKQTMAG